MSRRTTLLVFVGGATVTAAALLAVGIAAVRDGTEAARYRGSEAPGRILLPAFRLPTIDGRSVDSRKLRGRVVVTTFVDSACTESCPIIVSVLGRAIRSLDARERSQLAALAFSVNPPVDTPTHVRRFLRERHALGVLEYLVAPAARMRPVWDAFYVLPAVDTGDADVHSADVRIFDRRGVWVSTLHVGVDLTAANVAHDVRVALQRPSR